MESRKGSSSSNKIINIVRLRRMMKNWKKLAVAAQKTNAVPKGYVALCVGEELTRFVVPTEYLSHGAFGALLREAEEEFGFEQEGVLRIPCDVAAFERVVQAVERSRSGFCCCAAEADLSRPFRSQEPMCR